jgi:hypothetical protein
MASENSTPCLLALAAAFSGSHSNAIGGVYSPPSWIEFGGMYLGADRNRTHAARHTHRRRGVKPGPAFGGIHPAVS